MVAVGFDDQDKVPLTGGTVVGPLNLQGTPPFTLVEGQFTGAVTLNGTTAVSVAVSQITSASRVFLTPQPGHVPAGLPYVASITPGTGFTIASTSASDTALIVAWMIVNHA